MAGYRDISGQGIITHGQVHASAIATTASYADVAFDLDNGDSVTEFQVGPNASLFAHANAATQDVKVKVLHKAHADMSQWSVLVAETDVPVAASEDGNTAIYDDNIRSGVIKFQIVEGAVSGGTGEIGFTLKG